MDIELTDLQKHAIISKNNHICLLSCAGSGKTEVIVQRVINLIENEKVDPSTIVVFTFTKKAAEELRRRIMSHIADIKSMFIGTIHSFCLFKLRDLNPLEYNRYSILDENLQFLFLLKHNKEIGITPNKTDKGLKWSIKGVDFHSLSQLINVLINNYSVIVEENISTSLLSTKDSIFAEIYSNYQKLKKSEGYLDFGDLQRDFYEKIVLHTNNCKILQDSIKYLICDEYQDINNIQEQIIQGIVEDEGISLFVVGDDDQCIFQFRGTSPNNILLFNERYIDAEIIKLEGNFRSTSTIIEYANSIIQTLDNRLPKRMVPVRSLENSVKVKRFMTLDEEVDSIIAIIKDGRRNGLEFSDFAILFRSVKNTASYYIKRLKEENIPFRVVGDQTLFEVKEIQDLVDAFGFLTTQDSLSILFESFGQTVFGFDIKEINELSEKLNSIEDLENCDWNYVSKEDKTFIKEMFELKEKFAENKIFSLQETFRELIYALQLHLESNDSVLRNLGQFSTIIERYDQIFNPNCDIPASKLGVRFSNYLKYDAPDQYAQIYGSVRDAKAVQITTIHQAKGLEWPIVFIPHLNEKKFPVERYGDSIWLMNDSILNEFDHDRYGGSESEEIRLFYVAITRARDSLFLSACKNLKVLDKIKPREPSSFLDSWDDTSSFEECNNWNQVTSVYLLEKEQINSRTSFSKLNLFLKCPFLYKIREYYNFSPLVEPSFSLGILAHQLIQYYFLSLINQNPLSENDLKEILPELIKELNVPSYLLKRAFKFGTRLIQDFFKNENELIRLIPVKIEDQFEFRISDSLISGRIDLLMKEKKINSFKIIDLKTGKDRFEPLQLQIYALGIKNKYPDMSNLSVEFLSLTDFKPLFYKKITDDYLVQAQKYLSNILFELNDSDFDRPNFSHCRACDMTLICPYYDPEKIN